MQDELIKLLTQNCTWVYNTVRAIPKYRGTYMYISICLVHYMHACIAQFSVFLER